MKVALVLVILGLFAVAHCVPCKRDTDKALLAKTETEALATKDSAESKASSSSGNVKRGITKFMQISSDPDVLVAEDGDGDKQTLMLTKGDGSKIMITTRDVTAQVTDAKSEDTAVAKGDLVITDEADKAKSTRAVVQKTSSEAEHGTAVASGNVDNSAGIEKGSILQETSAKGGPIAISTSKIVTAGHHHEEEKPSLEEPVPTPAPAAAPKTEGSEASKSPATLELTQSADKQTIAIHKP